MRKNSHNKPRHKFLIFTTPRKRMILVLVAVILFLTCLIFILTLNLRPSRVNTDTGHQQSIRSVPCLIQNEVKTVSGDSLSPFIKNGTKITAIYGYYFCRTIQMGDVVLYDYPGDKNPLIKIIYGIPGDALNVKQTENGWNILINGHVLKNKEGIAYVIDSSREKMLHLYISSYGGLIPKDAYLILGDNPKGTLDSTVFGLVGKEAILAKVINY